MKKQVEALQQKFISKILNFEFEILQVTDITVIISVSGYKFEFLINKGYNIANYNFSSFIDLPEFSEDNKQKLYNYFSELIKENDIKEKRQQFEKLKSELCE